MGAEGRVLILGAETGWAPGGECVRRGGAVRVWAWTGEGLSAREAGGTACVRSENPRAGGSQGLRLAQRLIPSAHAERVAVDAIPRPFSQIFV